MSANSQPNPNSGHNSGHSYRRNRRQDHGFGNAFGFRSNNNLDQNSTHYHNNYYHPNNQWSDPQSTPPLAAPPTPSGSQSNATHFVDYPQNSQHFYANESQNSYQNNNPMNYQKSHQRRQDYRRPQQQSHHSRPNDAMNYTYDTNAATNWDQRSDDNNRQRVNTQAFDRYANNSSNQTKSSRNDNNRQRVDQHMDRFANNSSPQKNYRNGDNRRDRESYNNSRPQQQSGYDRSDRRDNNYDKNETKINSKETNSSDNSHKHNRRRHDMNKRDDKPKPIGGDSDESQREIMEEMLRKGEFECMVCCDQIRIRDTVWSCEHCFNVFHLKCVKTWANSQSAKTQTTADPNNTSWRCPACQAHHKRIPSRYFCFCGKVREPELNRYLTPHSCGEMCGRKRKVDSNRKYNCDHKCLLLCHPGSCPPCTQKVTRECGCGQTKITVNCATNDEDVVCDKICNKMLNCGQHFCPKACHSDACDVCPIVKTQHCFCGQHEKQVECNIENSLVDEYSCEEICNKSLNCGKHLCEQICHFGKCTDCPLDPKVVTHCCCGKTQLSALGAGSKRTSCTDPIATCDQICDKELVCGPDKEPHKCRRVCHRDVCQCEQKTVIRCRCGANSDNIECTELASNVGKTFNCKKRCNKKRGCGRHKCLNECCVDSDHKCDQICGRKLSCGLHACEDSCHNGSCAQCWNISWDELQCRCGAATKLPPIACGTKRPECGLVCSRDHGCDHQVNHICHDDGECPPCTYFVPKICYGEHESRPVQCYESGYSCGYLCGKPLDCGLHECQMICHFGDCNECTLPCSKTRDDCDHVCGLKCHQKTSPDACPKSKCKISMKVMCSCGRKTEQMPCFKVNDENAIRLSMNTLANQRIKNGESVNITEILRNLKDFKNIQLKCDDKCAVVERNRQLAEALDIKDATFSPDPGPPRYSDLLKNSARSESAFVADIYDKLTKLVIESKQSKLSFKNLNFPPMNSDNRHIIHELAEHFGCKTHAVDREPNRSVVVKASKDKCYLPTLSLMETVKLETEVKTKNKITLKNYSFDSETNDTNSSKLAVNTSHSMIRNISVDTNHTNTDSNHSSKQIDYFDFKGD